MRKNSRDSPVLKPVVLIQPFSAAAERVFSLLTIAFNERKKILWELSIMLQYNSELLLITCKIFLL